MSKLSAIQIVNEIKPETSAADQLTLGQKKLARLRTNIKTMRHEITDKLLLEIQDCRKCIDNTIIAIGDINVATQSKIK